MSRRASRRRRGALLLSSAVGLALLAAPGTASAQGTIGPGEGFSCRASVANVFGFEPIVANAPLFPCRSENKAIVFQTFASGTNAVTVEAAHAQTQAQPNGATAHAEAARALAAGAPGSLDVRGASADATVRCQGFHHVFTGVADVVAVTITQAGQAPRAIAIPPEHSHVPLGPFGQIHLKHTELQDAPGTGTDVYIARAVWWERPDPELDVIVAEAIVDSHGLPCQ